ncbi:MAG TPA: hypothetical protein VFJ16_27570 [Longimicrobium sp.]|nr:hypothetical protein [Longimicrobium sp.]
MNHDALTPPVLNEATVQHLRALSEALDGFTGTEDEKRGLVAGFNRLAGTELSFADFQGVCEGAGHDSWVRTQLARPSVRRTAAIGRDELAELVRRIRAGLGAAWEIEFWLELLMANVPDPTVPDLGFHPASRGYPDDLPPEEVAGIALRYQPVPLGAIMKRHAVTWQPE